VSKAKPITPYERLLDNTREFRVSVEFAHRVRVWSYPKAKLKDGWRLDDLFERVGAADQLGYDVVLLAKEEGLIVEYRKRPKLDVLPWSAR